MKNKIDSKKLRGKLTGPVVTHEEILYYRNISTERKLKWLEDMRSLLFATMNPASRRQWENIRKAGF